MFTFGYKSKVNGPMRAFIALVIGIMMVVSPANALTTVVKIIAAFMLASGVVSLVVGLKDKEKALAIIDKVCRTFDDYDPTAAALDNARREVLEALG